MYEEIFPFSTPKETKQFCVVLKEINLWKGITTPGCLISILVLIYLFILDKKCLNVKGGGGTQYSLLFWE